jgi:oligosaccharide repeat unit polymerase
VESTTTMCLLAAGLLLTLNLAIVGGTQRPWTYPPVLAAGAWTVALLVYKLQGRELWKIHIGTAVVMVIGIACFSFGGLVAAKRYDHDELAAPRPQDDELTSGRWMPVFLAIGLPFFVSNMLSAGAEGLGESLLINIRDAAIRNALEGQRGIVDYLVPLAIFGTTMHLLGVVKTTPRQTVSMLVLTLAYCALSTARFTFILLLTMVASGRVVQGLGKPWKLAVVAGVAFLAVFGGMAYLLDKGVDDPGQAVSQTASTLADYFVAGIAGLNDFVQSGENSAMLWGANMFRSLIALGAALGIAETPQPPIMEFRFVPIQTNVYTVFRPYLEDFGLVGVALTQIAFGFVHTMFWSRARQGDAVAAFPYGAMSFCALMQVFSDTYFSSLSLWFQGMLLLWIVRPRPVGVSWWRWRTRASPVANQ